MKYLGPLLTTRKWMDPSIILLVVFLVTVYLSSVLSNDDEEYMDLLAGRLTSSKDEARLHVWHSDCFSRCGHQLRRTIELACDFDPYVLQTRKKRSTRKRGSTDTSVFLTKRLASSFLHHGSSKRAIVKRKKRGITEECCYNVCAWEEYGEYCHGYQRTRRLRPSACI